jgi:hypothetical protein
MRIAAKEWQPADLPLCTPAISLVKYANDIVFTVEVGKFQVLDNAPSVESPIAELAIKYIETLPHVHYTAIGINITGYVECQGPREWILDRFIRQGAWNDASVHPNAVGLKLVCPVSGADLNLSVDAGSVHLAKKQREAEALLVNGNYHVGLSAERALEQAKPSIARYRERVEHFDQITQIVLGLEK